MINVSVTRGCDQDPAEQFNEGADTYVRVCNPASAALIVYSEEACTVVVKVDGEETLRSAVESNKGSEFPLEPVLKIKRSRSQLARAGFMALIGNAKPSKDELATEFVVEIRQQRPGAPIEASYKFILLSDEAFDQRFAGYLNERVVEEPKPIFTRDARPIECLANSTKCMACGTVISDCIAGCENAECPTLTPAVQAKVTGKDKGGKDKGDKK